MAFGTFREITPEENCVRKALNAETPAILNPDAVNALEQGEWVEPDGTTATNYQRHAAADDGPVVSYPVAAPKGSTDGQGLGKIDAYMHWKLAITTTYETGKTYNVGTALKVNQVAIGGQNYSILTPCDTDWDNIVAVVVEPPSSTATYEEMKIQQYTGVYHT